MAVSYPSDGKILPYLSFGGFLNFLHASFKTRSATAPSKNRPITISTLKIYDP
jgi:hypothetical protein